MNLDSASIVSDVRKLAGLTQAELARRSGTSQAAVARYENGTSHPSTATLQRLTKAAGFEVRVSLVAVASSDLSSKRALKLRAKRGEIKVLLAAAGASNPRIFGSVARGEDSKSSDIDLLVDFDMSGGLLPILQLNKKLSRLVGERVEVSPSSALKPSILESALKESVPL